MFYFFYLYKLKKGGKSGQKGGKSRKATDFKSQAWYSQKQVLRNPIKSQKKLQEVAATQKVLRYVGITDFLGFQNLTILTINLKSAKFTMPSQVGYG